MEIIRDYKNKELLNILFLEDDKLMHLLYKKSLKPAWGKCFNHHEAYSLEHAKSIVENLEKYDTGIHYAFLDYSLPDGEVTSFIKWCEKRKYEFNMSVVTGRADTKSIDAIKEYSHRVNSYIIKPITLETLRNEFKLQCCSLHKYDEEHPKCFDAIKGNHNG